MSNITLAPVADPGAVIRGKDKWTPIVRNFIDSGIELAEVCIPGLEAKQASGIVGQLKKAAAASGLLATAFSRDGKVYLQRLPQPTQPEPEPEVLAGEE